METFTVRASNPSNSLVGFPKVSIGLPVFNGEKTLELALDSILRQDYKNFEVIISDNASTDNTASIAQDYCRRDSRIRYESHSENRGALENFNHVFNSSVGEFFFWASHDDLRSSNFISSCIKALIKNPEAVLCSPRIEFFIPTEKEAIWTSDLHTFEGKRSIISRYKETLHHFPAAALYGVYRSSGVRRTDLFRSVIAADLLFIQELSLYGSFIHTNESVFKYMGRTGWNNSEQDYYAFYGNKRKPRFFSPFLIVLFNQIQIIFECDHALYVKLRLFATLTRFQIFQILKKLMLKVIRYALPKKARYLACEYLYWRFFHCPNVVAKRSDSYSQRIIFPSMGLEPF